MGDEERPEQDHALPAEPSTFVSAKPGFTHCSSCQHVTKPFYAKCPRCEGDRNRRKVDSLASVIRELKDSITGYVAPDRERELVKLLTTYDHPDPKGFLDALAAQRAAPKSNQRGNR